MAKFEMVQTRRRATSRDEQLRQAHQLAFARIRRAQTETARADLVADAVAELVEACERFVSSD